MNLVRAALRALRRARTRAFLRKVGAVGGADLRLYGRPHIRLAAPGTLHLGERVVLTSSWKANDLDAPTACTIRSLTPTSLIVIGDDSGLTSATVSCAQRIVIGQRVLVGAGVVITDTDHHPVDAGVTGTPATRRRFLPRPTPLPEHEVVIGDDVFIGARSIVLKGTRLGNGCVVGAGSVVSGVVEPRTVVAGNPARVVRSLTLSEGGGDREHGAVDDQLG